MASVNIGDGALVINGIRGVASVTRNGGKVTRSTEGTKVLEVVAQRHADQHPARADSIFRAWSSWRRTSSSGRNNGLKVVALRIHLLDGSLAVIDLGTAVVGIKRARR